MRTKQTIAIIGAAGNMGTAIARGLAKGRYRLILCANDLNRIALLRQEFRAFDPSAEVVTMDCPITASWEADIIILAVPYSAESKLTSIIKDVANQKIVISISNPLNNTFDGLVTAPDSSAAEELQKLLPHSKVVKAFNTVFEADFSTPVIDGRHIDAFVAGNDREAVQTVTELVKTVGFNPIVAGNLPVSGTLERMQLLLIQLGKKNNYNWLAGWKVLHQ